MGINGVGGWPVVRWSGALPNPSGEGALYQQLEKRRTRDAI